MGKRKTTPGSKVLPPRNCEPRARLSELEVAKLMIATECARTTVRNWMQGKPCKGKTNGQLSRAAASIGIEVRA